MAFCSAIANISLIKNLKVCFTPGVFYSLKSSSTRFAHEYDGLRALHAPGVGGGGGRRASSLFLHEFSQDFPLENQGGKPLVG